MSFTSIVKNEVSKLDLSETGNVSELSAIISAGAEINNSIKLTTENASVARHIYNLFKEMYNIHPNVTVRKGYNYSKNLLYIIEVKNNYKSILHDVGLYDNELLIIPKQFIIDDPEIIRYYLKGVFLLCGSINDPKTSRYHLELVVDSEEYASFISKLLNTYYLNSKFIKRENKYMIYVKEAEKISDFLRIISATSALFYYEDIRIYRDHKNMTNRLNNCEQANVDKTVEASSKQIIAIDKIIDKIGLEAVDEKLKEIMIYRKKYPDISLNDLSYIITTETGKSISKSGINHRIRKII